LLLQLLDISALFLAAELLRVDSSNAFNHLAKRFGKDVSLMLSRMMETIMRAQLFAIALLLAPAGAGAAEPAKSNAQAPAAQQAPAKIVLASAEDVHSPSATTQRDAAPAKRRIARVTTCRCGDPPPDERQQDE
jgi:hypothetical protein